MNEDIIFSKKIRKYKKEQQEKKIESMVSLFMWLNISVAIAFLVFFIDNKVIDISFKITITIVGLVMITNALSWATYKIIKK